MADFPLTEGTATGSMTFKAENGGEAAIKVTVNIQKHKAVVLAPACVVAEAVGKVLSESLPEEVCEEIGRYFQEISERKKREVAPIFAPLFADLSADAKPPESILPTEFDGDPKL